MKKSPLTIDQILAWADAHYQRTGRWPTVHSGPVHGVQRQTWVAVNLCLQRGLRGLPGGSSLARLLHRHRGLPYQPKKTPLTIAKIRRWAQKHRELTGTYPSKISGPIPGVPPEHWGSIDANLRKGGRGLPGGSSLAKVLVDLRGPWRVRRPLTISQILAWADAHYQRTGRWPSVYSGPVHGVRRETWLAINGSLRRGLRGLPGGSSLARLLAEQRGVSGIHARMVKKPKRQPGPL